MKKLVWLWVISTALYAASGQIDNMEVIHHNSSSNNYFEVKVMGSFHADQKFDLFLNTDNDKSTGYQDGIGAEYVITHNGDVSRYIGPDGGSWSEDIVWEEYWEYQYTSNSMWRSDAGINVDIGLWEIPALNDNAKFYMDTYSDSWVWQDWQESGAINQEINEQTVYFIEDEKPIRNPIKGFKGWNSSWDVPFSINVVGLASIKRLYIPLDSLIRKVSDSEYEVINDLKLTHFLKTTNEGSFKKEIYPGVLDALFDNNIKIVPRIVAHTDTGYKWIDGLDSSTYYKSEEFRNMVKFLIPKLVEKWDNDPNIAYIEMGLVGSYGEFYVDKLDYTFYDEETLSILTAEFSKLSKKQVTTGGISGYNNNILEYIPSTILSNKFGISWDSFISTPLIEFFGLALEGERTQNWTGNKQIDIDLWKTKPYVGEVAYNINVPNTGLGGIPFNDTETSLRMKQSIEDPNMVDVLVNSIKKYHMSDLSWISNYERTDQAEMGATKIHKALGYRFVLKEATYKINARVGETVNIAFKVSNDGSAPFYYKWPLVVSIIDENFNIVSNTKTDIDITKWIEGDYNEKISFKIPSNIPDGKYYVALSIQEKNTPSLRFANINYFNGGYTPLGYIGIGDRISTQNIDSSVYDETDKDPAFNLM